MDAADMGLAGQVAWLQLLADSNAGRSWGVGTGFAVVTGLWSNSENGIVLDREALGDHGVVRALVEAVKAERVPASLILSEPVPADEFGVLLDMGLELENSANEMSMPIDSQPSVAQQEGVDLVEVVDSDMLRDGLKALGKGWLDDTEMERYASMFEGLGYGPGHRVRHWAARRTGRAIAMASSFRFDGAVTLMHCGVLESERRQGIATALTRARLRAANENGATVAVLSPSHDGYQLHRSLGFELRPCPQNRWFYLPS